MDELNMLTAEEARKFAKELDIYVCKLTKPGFRLVNYNLIGPWEGGISLKMEVYF